MFALRICRATRLLRLGPTCRQRLVLELENCLYTTYGSGLVPCRSFSTSSSVDGAEISKFNEQAARWWDPAGVAAPLHRLNPVRVAFIRAAIERRKEALGLAVTEPTDVSSEQTGLDATVFHDFAPALAGVAIADVGCGGGLVSEPLARLGADVDGIDMSSEGISVATRHASMDPGLEHGKRLRYEMKAVEDLVHEARSYDVVLALEIVEHVATPAKFLKDCSSIVRPGGLLVLSTLNRTAASLAFGVVAAENILRWVPEGTHDWNRFPTPSEVADVLEIDCGLVADELAGITFDPIRKSFYLSEDLHMNYIMTAYKPL